MKILRSDLQKEALKPLKVRLEILLLLIKNYRKPDRKAG